VYRDADFFETGLEISGGPIQVIGNRNTTFTDGLRQCLDVSLQACRAMLWNVFHRVLACLRCDLVSVRENLEKDFLAAAERHHRF